MAKRILALDLATVTGWATDTHSGTENFRKRAGDSRGMIYIRFEAWLVDAGGLLEPELIVYERPHARGRAANELLNGLLAILQKYCEQCGIEYTDCPSTTLKKFATGRGNAGKEEMMAAYRQRWGVDPQDDNECDARWLNAWAQEQFNNNEARS